MTDLPLLFPLGIGVVAALFAAAVTVLAVRVLRRSAGARRAASAARVAAEDALSRLDDAVDDVESAFEASDAFTGDVTPDLRRARGSLTRARDRGFTEVAALGSPGRVPADVRTDAVRIRARLDSALADAERTRASLQTWAAVHRPAADRIAAARTRLAAAREIAGDPATLIDGLARRFAPEDWADAAAAADSATDAFARAATALDAATTDVDDVDARLTEAATETRAAQRHVRAFEDAYRATMQAADNAAAEVAAVRAELTEARGLVAARPDTAVRDADKRLRQAGETLEAIARDGDRRPRAAVEAVARIRRDVDLALADARSPRQRLEAARAALPGTLACARGALSAADGRADRGSVSTRLHRERARTRLAAARAATDPVSALAIARAAWDDAIEATAP